MARTTYRTEAARPRRLVFRCALLLSLFASPAITHAQGVKIDLISSQRREPALPNAPEGFFSQPLATPEQSDGALRLALSPSLQPSVVPATPVVQLPEAAPTEANSASSAKVEIAAPPTVAGMTLEQFESIALANNPAIRAAAAAVVAARGNAIQVGLPPNPTVGYQGQQIGSGGRAEQDGVQVSQDFVPHVKRNLNRTVAQRDVQMAEQRYSAQRTRVVTDVRIAFYRTVRAQRQIDVTRELVDISTQALKAAQSLFEAKEVAKTDMLRAQIEVDVAQTLLENAFNQHQSAWNQLTAVVALPGMEVQTLSADLFAPPAPLDFESTLAMIRSRSPELCEASLNVQRARAFLQRQIVEPRPNVGVQALYNFRDEGIGGKPDGGLGLTVPVPVWNRNQGAIQQARYQVSQAEQAYAQLDLALQQRLAPVFERFSNAKNQVSRYGERILPAAAETLELTRRTFTAGEIGFTDLLIAQRSYSQQQLLYLDSAEALRLAEAEIDGLLLTGSLTTTMPMQ